MKSKRGNKRKKKVKNRELRNVWSVKGIEEQLALVDFAGLHLRFLNWAIGKQQ